MKPIVTIIMATYNRAHFIIETLHSIQKQTFENWECIIIDDGGTDNTLELITPILEKDTRFKFLKRKASYQKGLPGCRNYGLDLANGEYIIFFDDDDIVHPQNLECCVNALEKKVYSFCRYDRSVFVGKFDYQFDLNLNFDSFEIAVNDLEHLLTNKLPFNSCAVMWRKDCFLQNKFAENLMYAEEWELYSRLLSTGIKGISIKKTLFFGRKHPNSNTGEFYSNNPIRKQSKAEAIALVTENLASKNLLSKSIFRYFLQLSLGFKEYNLFQRILKNSKFNIFYKIYWQILYLILPLKLALHKKIK